MAIPTELSNGLSNGPEAFLVADIGGTYARFGLASTTSPAIRAVETLLCADYASPAAAAVTYLASRDVTVRHAALAVAGPVVDDRIELTNNPWSFSRRDLRDAMRLDRLLVLNDFAALALALPSLADADFRSIQPGTAIPGAPLALLGPGTGLGISAWVPCGTGGVALATEGGHRDLVAANAREWEVIRALSTRSDPVSAESVLCGAGLVQLEATLRQLSGQLSAHPAGRPPRLPDARSVVSAAREAPVHQDTLPSALEAVRLFSGWLGAVAGDLVLTLGARGGLFLGGGMLPKMEDAFDHRAFLERFLHKGRFRGYLEAIPVRVITDPLAALRGGALALQRDDYSTTCATLTTR